MHFIFYLTVSFLGAFGGAYAAEIMLARQAHNEVGEHDPPGNHRAD